MTTHLSDQQGLWADTKIVNSLLEQVEKIGPVLNDNADKDEALNELSEDSYSLLKPLKLSHMLVPKTLGGEFFRPTDAIRVLEKLSYFSGSAGWVSMVHATIGAMSAGFLPDSAVERLFAPGSSNRFSGQGAPLGMLKRVEGGYRLTGKWSYGSGFSHADFSHSAAFIDDGDGNPVKDDTGRPLIFCAHAPIKEHTPLGNWDVLGLNGTGSIDYAANDLFVPEDLVYAISPATPQREEAFYSLDIAGLAAIGHTAWAMGASRRILDEISGLARSKVGRPGSLGESEKFWFDYGDAEADVRASSAFIFDVWQDIENTIAAGEALETRQISLLHLAKYKIHQAAEHAANFAYRSAGGAGLRAGSIQRIFREVMVALNHMTNSPALVHRIGRELGSLWSDRHWRDFELV